MSSPPSALSSRAGPRDVSTRDAQRMHQALRVLWMVLASYGVDTALLGLLAWAGAVDSQAALVMGVGGVLVFAGFRLAFSMGLSSRVRDHYLTVPQLAVSSGVFLAVAAWFPAVNLLLLTLIFVVFAFAALLDAHGRAAGATAVVLVDLDRFKAINDLHGHPVGDEVLRRVVTALGCMMRSVDRLGRHGGEEFLVVLPSTASAEAAVGIAERLCETIRTQPWDDVAPGLRVTASFGVVYALTGDSSYALLERADEALYRAKREGRDCVRLAT
jgi:diguanylate cyclase (GGDEF)-like protein